jgi:hypothetical protein
VKSTEKHLSLAISYTKVMFNPISYVYLIAVPHTYNYLYGSSVEEYISNTDSKTKTREVFQCLAKKGTYW